MNQIVNNAIPAEITSKGSGGGLAFYIATLWKTVVIVGGLGFLIYLIWGGIEYLTSGGDKGKITEAQGKITSAIVGIGILVATYAITLFIQAVFKINILAPVFPNNLK